VFAKTDWDVAEKTTFSLSGRYDHDKRNQTNAANGDERSDEFSSWQPAATLTQKFDANQVAYLTASTGFRSGGFNGVGQLAPFQKELLRNFEVDTNQHGWISACCSTLPPSHRATRDFSFSILTSTREAPSHRQSG